MDQKVWPPSSVNIAEKATHRTVQPALHYDSGQLLYQTQHFFTYWPPDAQFILDYKTSQSSVSDSATG